MGSITMLIIGTVAALAFPPELGSNKNLIDFANGSDRALTIAAVYVFCLANNITTIPVFSIMIRYTLLEHKILRKPWIANLLAILLPWMLVIPFSTGSGFDVIIEFGGSIFIGVTCFVAPPVLFLCALKPDWWVKLTGSTADVEDLEKDIPTVDEDSQFPVVAGKKQTDLMSYGTVAILAALMASLIYSWYTAA